MEWFFEQVDAGAKDTLGAENALGAADMNKTRMPRLWAWSLPASFFPGHVRHDDVKSAGRRWGWSGQK